MPHRPALAQRSSAWLRCALLALGLGGCTFSNRQPEVLGPEPGGSDAAAEGGAGESSAPDAAVSGNAGAAGMQSAGQAGAAGKPAPAPDAGGSGSTGGPAPTLDAGNSPSDDAMTEDAAQVDDITCAFELSACIILDPLNFEACVRTNMERCKLLAADGGVPASPSPACSMQTAQCIMEHPNKAQECLDMQKNCTL